jgi:beta-alanine degradation protein BauB
MMTPRQCSRRGYSLCATTDLIAASGKSAMEASSNRRIETDRVVVTEWHFTPGAETGYHVHDHDYVVIPLVTGVVRVVEPSGDEREFEMLAGASYARPAGVAHNLINTNEYDFRFVEVELREPGPVSTSSWNQA